MDKRLNFFAPYENTPAWHENQLTRALLVVLRYSPMSHEAWMRLVAPDRSLHNLPKPEFATQRQRVLNEHVKVLDGEAIEGVSVWLAPNPAQVDESICHSDRLQVLDGIITYGTELVVVIENKITANTVTEQPHQINLHGSPVVFKHNPRSVSWQQLLGILSDLIQRELIAGAEGMLVADFLDLVEEYFPQIGPYSKLGRCGSNGFRLSRRLDAIQGEALKTEVGKAQGWRDIEGTDKIFMAWLGLSDDDSSVCLRMYPGDTLGQSRAFYGDPAGVHAVLALRAEGWNIEPNFHWGFMAAGYAWMKTVINANDYCAYWLREIGKTRELGRSEWADYWSRLQADGIVTAGDKSKFDAEFPNSQRQKAHPRPGLCCEYRWTLQDAKQLDTQGEFAAKVRERVNQMLDALCAPLIAH